MADNRTTPETPSEAAPEAGPRRRKRVAPTIDLTATEVPPRAAARSDQPPAADSEVPPAAGKSGSNGSNGNPWTWRIPISVSTLAAGVAGAALMSLVLCGLWLSGLVPVRYAEPATPSTRITALETAMRDLQSRPAGVADTKSSDALGERLSKIETALANVPAGEAGVAERLATIDNAMNSLGVALAALNHRNDDIAGNAALARDRAEAAEKLVAELRMGMQDAAKNNEISPSDLDALQKRIAAATDTPARLALSASALRDAATSGAPFSAELAQVKSLVNSLGADVKTLAALEPYAATGLPAQSALTQELRALIPAMLKTSGAQAPIGGFLERLQANAGNLVRVRPVDAPPGDDTSAVLARLEIDAARADIAAALADLAKLSDATRAPAQGWIAKAQARQAALTAARQLAADTAHALGPR
jgi:hypothetical protein